MKNKQKNPFKKSKVRRVTLKNLKEFKPFLKPSKRKFLCKEPGGLNLPDEIFTIEANSLAEASKAASIWNAVVIKEIKQ